MLTQIQWPFIPSKRLLWQQWNQLGQNSLSFIDEAMEALENHPAVAPKLKKLKKKRSRSPKKEKKGESEAPKSTAAVKPTTEKRKNKIVELNEKLKLLEKTVGDERRRAIAVGLERDQLQLLLSTTTDKLNDQKSQSWLQSREFEEQTKQHDVEDFYLRQKLKYLLRGETDKLHQTILEHLEKKDKKPTVEIPKQPEIQLDPRETKSVSLSAYEPGNVSLDSPNQSSITNLKLEYEDKLKTLEQLSQMKLKRLQDELTSKHRKEIDQLNQSRLDQFQQLVKSQDQKMGELRRTYEIKQKLQLEDTDDLEKKLEDISKANDSLEKQLKISRTKCEQLQSNLDELSKWKADNSQKLSLATNQAKEIQVLRTQLQSEKKISDGLRIDTEKTIKKFKQLEKERDRLYECFMSAIGEIDRRAEEKSELLKTQLLEVRSILDSWRS